MGRKANGGCTSLHMNQLTNFCYDKNNHVNYGNSY